MKKKRLVFFIGGLNFGGMERVVFIAKELLQDEYDIRIVTLYQSEADYDVKSEYYNIDVPPSNKKIKTFIMRLLGTIKMRKELQPDIIFSFGMYLNYLNVLSHYFSLNKACRVVGLRSYDWLTDSFFSKITDKWIVQHADKVNSVSDLIAKDAEKIWGIPYKRNKVIYNPYNVEEIQKKSRENIDDFIFEKSCYYIITMGRLSDQKGYNHLVRAMNIVKNETENVKLLILGNGDKYTELSNMINNYRLNDSVILLGGKKNPLKYVKHANLYVLSSLAEGFPNALAEAMCVGTPVVAVNCKSGPAELLNEDISRSIVNNDYLVCDYGILTKEMIPDHQYNIRENSVPEKCLAEAILYAYSHEEEMEDIARKAVERMHKFDYSLFKNSMVEALEN